MKKERKVAAVVLVALLVFLIGFGLGTSKGININVNVDGAGSNAGGQQVAATQAPVTQAPVTQAPATTAASSGDANATTPAGAGDATTAAPAGTSTGIPEGKDAIVAKYCEVINAAKKEQGKISIHKVETISLNCTDCSVGFLKGTIDGALGALAKGGDWSWDFENGKTADGGELPHYIAPGADGRDCTLQPSGVASATATPDGDGYRMEITLNPEKSTFDGTNTVNPENNNSCLDPLNLATIEIPIKGVSITAADMDYPGTKLTANVNGAGKLTKLIVDLPMSGNGTGGVGKVGLTVGIEGSLQDTYDFTY